MTASLRDELVAKAMPLRGKDRAMVGDFRAGGNLTTLRGAPARRTSTPHIYEYPRPDETLEDAARRELEEGTGLRNVYPEQLYTFGDVERDPRERVVSVPGCEADSASRSAGGFDTMGVTRHCRQRRSVVQNTYPPSTAFGKSLKP
jgi:NUDIX domain